MYLWQQLKPQKPAPSPRPSKNLQWKQICMSGLDTSYWKFSTHPKTSFRINERLPDKYHTHKSTIKKIRLGERSWRIFYIKQSNQLKQTCLKIQPASSPRPSTNLKGKQTRLSGLDTAHIKFAITPGDKFQYQWMLSR